MKKFKFKKSQTVNLFFIATFFLLSTGCYRMPNEDECSLLPTTNNPSITRESGNELIPGGCF